MLKVYRTPCKNCLFHKNRIVPTESAARHIQHCASADTHFICHVPSDGEGYSVGEERKRETEVVCAGFYEQFQDPDSPLCGVGAVLRMATAFGAVELIEQPEGREMLTPARTWER